VNTEGANKAVKGCYSERIWNPENLRKQIAEKNQLLKPLQLKNKSLNPGVYRAYLSPDAMSAIADKLKGGLYKGFGGTLANFEGPPLELLTELRSNIYMFSGAKTFQQTLEMSEALTDGNRVLSWPEYKQVAADIYAKHNGGDYLQGKKETGYLQTEYETSVTEAQNASNWTRIMQQKKTLPYLQKSVVEDENTCAICGPLQGFTAPIDHPAWKKLAGALNFRCRCFELQLDSIDGEAEYDEHEAAKLEKSQTELMQPMFKKNVYFDKAIFSKDAPYFVVPKKYQELAKENFNLPIPEKD
jgi:SPP1 gp7 family putative phage head morphogenesis protein